MGSGENLKKVYDAKKPKELAGMDFCPRMVARAKTKFNGNVDLRVADAASLPFENEYFDVTMCFNALDRIPKTKKALNEISRVTRNRGTLILGQCIPFQNEKVTVDGTKIIYVPKDQRIESIDEIGEIQGFSLQKIYRAILWPITTIEDGYEELKVDVGIFKKYEVI